MKKSNILITDYFDTDLLNQFKKKFRIDYFPEITPDRLADMIHDYEILVGSTRIRISPGILEKSDHLKLLIRMGIGVDHIDLDECRKRRITVCNTPFSNVSPVVELIFGQMIRLYRNPDVLDKNVTDGKFRDGIERGSEIKNKTIGIIGVGRIGSRVAEIAKQFEMNTLGNDPYLTEPARRKIKVDRWVTKNKLIRESDIVTIHVPLTEETKYMVDNKFLSLMKKGSVLINTSRGKVVRFNDLVDFAKKGIISKFILDVFEEEPFKPILSKDLFNFFYFSPHAGSYTKESFKSRCVEAFKEIEAFLNGKKPHGIIDFKKGY